MSQIVMSIPNLVITICDDTPATFLSFISPRCGSNFVVSSDIAAVTLNLFWTMSVRYQISKQKIGFGTDKKEAYVGRVQLGETVETDMLVEQISLRTGMNEA